MTYQFAGLFTLALEWPIPYLRESRLGRSLEFKLVWYIFCGFLARTFCSVSCQVPFVLRNLYLERSTGDSFERCLA